MIFKRFAMAVATFALLVCNTGCVLESEDLNNDSDTSRTVDPLFQYHTSGAPVWPYSPIFNGTIVPLCFRTAGSVGYHGDDPYFVGYSDPQIRQQKIELVLDALRATWQKWTSVLFVNLGDCESNQPIGIVSIDLLEIDCGGCGVCYNPGYHRNGVMRIHLGMENSDNRLLRTVAVHELGHQLGFAHEMDRPDNWVAGVPTCDNAPSLYNDGNLLTPYYDDISVMNYCSPRNRNNLSLGDIEGAQLVYGRSTADNWRRASASLALLTW